MKLSAKNISMKYKRQTKEANFFYGVYPQDLEVKEASLTVIFGRSGSGKTTLLNILSGLQKPTEGQVLHGETDIYAMDDEALSLWRGTRLGIIPQGRSLLDTLTVQENVMLPGMLHGGKTQDNAKLEKRCQDLLTQLEIAHLKHSYPSELSGGELRRGAIARALVFEPFLIFADEPTGDLDDISTQNVLKLLRREADRGAAVVMVTHDKEAAHYADHCYRMDAGVLTKEK